MIETRVGEGLSRKPRSGRDLKDKEEIGEKLEETACAKALG